MITDDVNELISPEEKYSINKRSSTRYNVNNFIQEHNLIDLSSVGNPDTWYNKRDRDAAVYSRLDRALENHFWIKTFTRSLVRHLPIFGSDHAPIILEIQNPEYKKKNSTFKSEVKWLLLEKDFFSVVKSSWSSYIRGSFAYKY